jgi:hypothetical protein
MGAKVVAATVRLDQLDQAKPRCEFVSPKSPQVAVQFVFTLVENRGFTQIDGEEAFVISKSRRWSYRQGTDLGREGSDPFKIQYPYQGMWVRVPPPAFTRSETQVTRFLTAKREFAVPFANGMIWPGRNMAISSGLIFWPALAAALALAVVWIYWSKRNIPFDTARWNAAPEIQKRKQWRLRMAGWLVKRNILLGKTRGQVADMLGPPSDSFWFEHLDWECYDLYECSFFSLNFLALGIRYDDKGVVIEAAFVEG